MCRVSNAGAFRAAEPAPDAPLAAQAFEQLQTLPSLTAELGDINFAGFDDSGDLSFAAGYPAAPAPVPQGFGVPAAPSAMPAPGGLAFGFQDSQMEALLQAAARLPAQQFSIDPFQALLQQGQMVHLPAVPVTAAAHKRSKTMQEAAEQEARIKKRRRESAARSRQRKSCYVNELEKENEALRSELAQLRAQLGLQEAGAGTGTGTGPHTGSGAIPSRVASGALPCGANLDRLASEPGGDLKPLLVHSSVDGSAC